MKKGLSKKDIKRRIEKVEAESLRKQIRELTRKRKRLCELQDGTGYTGRAFTYCPVSVTLSTRKRLNILKAELGYISIDDLVTIELLDRLEKEANKK